MTIPKNTDLASPDPAGLALAALGWLLSDGERAERFLDLTGLTPDGLRAAVGDIAMYRAVLDFLAAHEPDLIAAAAALEVPPETFIRARQELGR